MHETQTIVTNVHSVCLSVFQSCLAYGSTQLHCAKTANQIKMLFGLNTLGARGTLCYTGVLIPPSREREGELGKILPIMDPLHISGTTEARDLNYCVHIDGGPKKMQK